MPKCKFTEANRPGKTINGPAVLLFVDIGGPVGVKRGSAIPALHLLGYQSAPTNNHTLLLADFGYRGPVFSLRYLSLCIRG